MIEWNSKRRHDRTIDVAINFIRRNYADDISLEDVAMQARMSATYFSTYFRQETGNNFVAYLTRLRMDEAKSLMGVAELRLYEISGMVGYRDVKYFSRLFKRQTGMTPAQYRESIFRKE